MNSNMQNFTNPQLKIIYHAVKNYQTSHTPYKTKIYDECGSILSQILTEIRPPIEPAYDSDFYEKPN